MSYLLGITEWTFILATTHSFPLARCDLFFLIFFAISIAFLTLSFMRSSQKKTQVKKKKKKNRVSIVIFTRPLGTAVSDGWVCDREACSAPAPGSCNRRGGRAAEQPRVAGAKGEAACAFNQVAFLRARGVCV